MTATVQDRLKDAFRPTPNGVVGLTDQLFAACAGVGVEFESAGDRCVYRWREGEAVREEAAPFPPTAFRTILARVAALCNEQAPNSVTPYGGASELTVGESKLWVEFINTPAAQKLAVGSAPRPLALTLTFPIPADGDREALLQPVMNVAFEAQKAYIAFGGSNLFVDRVTRGREKPMIITLSTPDGPGAADRLRRVRDAINEGFNGPIRQAVEVKAELAVA